MNSHGCYNSKIWLKFENEVYSISFKMKHLDFALIEIFLSNEGDEWKLGPLLPSISSFKVGRMKIEINKKDRGSLGLII